MKFILGNWLIKLWWLTNPKSADWPSRLETQRSAESRITSELRQAVKFSLAWGGSIFCPIQTFNWLGEAHLHYRGQSAYSELTDLNVNLIQKYPRRNIQNNVWLYIWSPWPSWVEMSNIISTWSGHDEDVLSSDRILITSWKLWHSNSVFNNEKVRKQGWKHSVLRYVN